VLVGLVELNGDRRVGVPLAGFGPDEGLDIRLVELVGVRLTDVRLVEPRVGLP
jgi:hypothetical protein